MSKRKATKQAAPKKTKKAKKEESDGSGSDDDGSVEETVATDFSTPKLEDGELKIVTWNVAGWNAILKKGFEKYLKAENPDILCLNETKFDEDKIKQDQFAGYHTYFYSCTSNKGYSGVGLLSKVEPVKVIKGIGVDEHDKEGRVITAEYDTYYIIATYIPNAGAKDKSTGFPKDLDYRMKWDVDFQKFLKGLDEKKPIIWCGDLNVAHKEIDIKNPKTNTKTAGFTQKERDSFGNFLSQGFVDTYRELHPKETDCFSFWSYRQNCRAKDIGWRLDYFVASKELLPNVTQAYIRKHVQGSDHCPIAIHFKVPEARKEKK